MTDKNQSSRPNTGSGNKKSDSKIGDSKIGVNKRSGAEGTKHGSQPDTKIAGRPPKKK